MNRSILSMLLGTFVLRVSTAITGFMLIYLIDDLTKHQGNGPGLVSILTGGFYATELTGAIVFGVLADRYGRKVIMLLGPIFGGIAVFLTGLTTHLPVLFVTRLLEGSSTAASVPSTLGFIAAETAHDERLRGRVVSLFELVSLGGMLAVGPILAGRLWEAFGREAFFMNCGLYLVALLLYAYGVHEVPRQDRAEMQAAASAQRATGSTVSRYMRIAMNPKVLLFAPTWLAINAILGLWATQATLLLKGNIVDPSQFLMKGVTASTIGDGTAVLAAVFGAGILFWGLVYARFRRTTLLLIGVCAFVVMTLDILAINHFGGVSTMLLLGLGAVAVVALFVLSGATPAALGLLADVSEGFEEDRSAIMGLYSVFLGLGQVIGAVVGGLAATWKGIDGLIVATAGLLFIAIVALANLRRHERVDFDAVAGGRMPATMRDAIRDSLLLAEGGRSLEPEAKPEEKP
ncbi:MAG TPA: MFS transporter [Candidatus Limnocylindrales bacterium]